MYFSLRIADDVMEGNMVLEVLDQVMRRYKSISENVTLLPKK